VYQDRVGLRVVRWRFTQGGQWVEIPLEWIDISCIFHGNVEERMGKNFLGPVPQWPRFVNWTRPKVHIERRDGKHSLVTGVHVLVYAGGNFLLEIFSSRRRRFQEVKGRPLKI